MTETLKRVNDFVVKFANVNGTGSASANLLFTKSIFKMGIYVSPKNLFPSNIQGLPTWYEVRVNDKGYLGRRDEVDLMIAMNSQSFDTDSDSVREGGYLLYDSTKMLYPEQMRHDINYIGVPIMEMCNKEFADPRQRLLFKNIVYVGALSSLLNIEYQVLEELISEQFKGKEKLIQPNIKALRLGADYVKLHFNCPLDIRVERRTLTHNSIIIDGNTSCGLGAVYAGATFAAWYPITPSTSVADAFEMYCEQYRMDKATGERNFAIVQAEDELSAIGMAIGANWNGARAFTATSGPGLSLMNEFLGLAYFAEVPVVLIDVQRTGPSTGMPTRVQQSDVLKAAYASHGDTKHILLFPSTPKECFELTADAFDLAEELQTPVMVMTDLDLGMNDHICEPFEWDDKRQYKRGKVLTATALENMHEKFGRYLDTDNDGITWRTIPATHPTKGAYVTRGTSRDEYATYTEEGPPYERNMERLLKKFNTAKKMVPEPVLYQKKNNFSLGAIFFGTTTQPALEAIDLLKDKDIFMDALRIKAFPFNDKIKNFIDAHDKIFVIELNRDAQLRSLLLLELGVPAEKLIPVLQYDGLPITADAIMQQVEQKLNILPKLKSIR